MSKRWGRNVWRFLESCLAELVWLDPTLAAFRLSTEPAPAPVLRVHRPAPVQEHRVA